MIKFLCAAALAAMLTAPVAAASHVEGMKLPKCSAKVMDSCDQGADNPAAMTAAQAEASGGVGDRRARKATPMASKKKVAATTTVTTTEPTP